MGDLKKLLAIILTIGMCVGISYVGIEVDKQYGESEEPIEVIETQEVHVLTREDYEKLYTCKQDVRKTDDSIIEVTYEEAQQLMRVAKAESGYNDFSQAYIMGVVTNRVENELFPNTISEVIFQKNPVQFSSTVDGGYNKAEIDVNSHLALAMLERGEVDHNALYFEASWLEDSWQSHNREFLFEYGGTRYYK